MSLVRQFGGNVTNTLNVKCTIVIYQNGDYNHYTKAIAFKLPIVTPKFIKRYFNSILYLINYLNKLCK